jgi:hypothetical protein
MTLTQARLFDHLVNTGVIDTKGINDHPRQRWCPCGQRVWAAWLDGTGPAITVDPIALTPLGELQAQVAGARTVEHWMDGLALRRPEAITRWPAGNDPAYPIRPEHQCEREQQFDHIPERKPDAEYDQPPF